MIDTLTLTLHGDVPLDLFAQAIRYFDALVEALGAEVDAEESIDWKVSHLQSGSATVQVRGLSEDFDAVERAVRAYAAVGEALQHNEPIPFSPTIQRSAQALTRLLNGHITSLSFTTDTSTHVVQSVATDENAEQQAKWLVAWGSLTGDVGAISTRPQLQFTLYDSLFDKAVGCYLNRESERLAREIWNKRVTVTGRIYRRAEDGKPVRIRDVANVQVLSPTGGDFRRVRGADPWQPGDELPEVVIRRLRDAS